MSSNYWILLIKIGMVIFLLMTNHVAHFVALNMDWILMPMLHMVFFSFRFVLNAFHFIGSALFFFVYNISYIEHDSNSIGFQVRPCNEAIQLALLLCWVYLQCFGVGPLTVNKLQRDRLTFKKVISCFER